MSKWTTQREATRWIDNTFMRARIILAGEHFSWDDRGNYKRAYDGRDWFRREVVNARLHDAVYKMMEIYRPHDWQQLLLEWPHKSATDPNRLAYTRDERSGEADRQVITTIGKYLTRHFPDAPSDLIRDIVAEHTYGGAISIVTDMQAMVNAVMNGPASCMTKRFDILCDDGEHRHPYAVYAPSLGWSMVVRHDPTDGVMGRCLVWQDPNNPDDKGFVRSYKRERGGHGHSGTDEAIESYLRGLGYNKWGGWPDGTPIMEYPLRRGGWLMPYIDGCTQRVEEDGFVIHECGDIVADQTSGTANAFSHTCEDCGGGIHEDDVRYVGPHEDRCVGECCIESYTYVYGRRRNEYYVPDDEAVYVDGEYYHLDYLSDNNIVELVDGDYAHSDNAIYIDSVDAYYHIDDGDIVYAENTNQYELRCDCWQCEETNNWYTDDEDSVEVDGKLYHPAYAPEPETDDEDEEEEVETAVEAEPTVTLVAVVDATIDERFSLVD